MTRFDEPLPDEPLTRFATGGEEIEQSNRLRRRALYRTATVEEVKQRQAHVSWYVRVWRGGACNVLCLGCVLWTT